MDNILKDLYFGRYAAFERKYEPDGDHAEAIERVVNLEEALVNSKKCCFANRMKKNVTFLCTLLKSAHKYSILTVYYIERRYVMGRENKKEAIAALHREQIMKAAETLFSEKGYVQTTIEDISKISEYSRRTIYTYFESKDDILHHIIEKGLVDLKAGLENALNFNGDFIMQYKAAFNAMKKYHEECPHSVENVNNAKSHNFDYSTLSDTVKHILGLGTEINELLATFIEKGKVDGIVRQDIVPMMSVYVLWSNITSLLTLSQTKGKFISKQFSISEDEFLDYGFKQIINSILEVRI